MTLVLGFLQFLSLNAQTLPFPESADYGPTTFALGGSAAAVLNGHDGFRNNPATLIYYQGKGSAGGSYQMLPGDQSQWSVSVIDGSSMVISGFHFGWSEVGGAKRHSYTIAGAYKTPYGSFGATADALDFYDVGPGKGWHFSGSFGVFVPVFAGFSVGAFSKHFLDYEDNKYLPPTLSVGVSYLYPEKFKVTFDADRRFDTPHPEWNYSVGADWLLAWYFAVRGGYRWENHEDRSFWSGGLALQAPKIEIAATYTRFLDTNSGDAYGFDLNTKF